MTTSERPAPAQETGPAENVATAAPLSVQNSVIPLPLSWARQLIENAGGYFPPYGSREWSALDNEDRRKVAACVAAAEEWRTRNHRADVLDFPQSRRARQIAEARRPRPGDYLGGPVPWEREAGDV
jgi:hypothetical protein